MINQVDFLQQALTFSAFGLACYLWGLLNGWDVASRMNNDSNSM